MSENQQPPSRLDERHPLDGICLRLPVPHGHHHAEVVASLARWLGLRRGLEPFDMQVFDTPGGSGGVLSMRPRPLPPNKRLGSCLERSRAAIERAHLMAILAAELRSTVQSTQRHARLLAVEGRRQQERSKRLQMANASLRHEATMLLSKALVRQVTTSLDRTFTGRP